MANNYSIYKYTWFFNNQPLVYISGNKLGSVLGSMVVDIVRFKMTSHMTFSITH